MPNAIDAVKERDFAALEQARQHVQNRNAVDDTGKPGLLIEAGSRPVAARH